MGWIVGGIVALVLAAIGGVVAYLQKRRVHAMITTETLTAQELETLRASAGAAAGPGSFRYRCEVAGTVRPGPDGPVRSQLSDTECVWHEHKVTRKYWTTRHDSEGHRHREEHEETVAQNVTAPPFVVQDATGGVLVRLGNKRPEQLDKVVDRFEDAHEGAARTELKVGKFSLALPSTNSEGTIGYRYEEWVMRPGRSVYVLGEASDASGRLEVGKPEEGPFIVSGKDEQDLIATNRKRSTLATAAAAVAGPLGVVLIVIGLIVR